jgi:membrane fusion protein (multidrug efflux system)
VPVRIELDAEQLRAHPLRVGLSMTVEVEVRDTAGTQLAPLAGAGPAFATQMLAVPAAGAEARVRAIIAAHR